MARILVVDDDRTILGVLTEYLGGLGHDIVGASSGREAIEAAKEDQFQFALVDWSMAGITGRDVVEFFRREAPETTVLVSTGHDPGNVSDSLAGRHAKGVLRKPFSLNQLSDLINKLDPSRHTEVC